MSEGQATGGVAALAGTTGGAASSGGDPSAPPAQSTGGQAPGVSGGANQGGTAQSSIPEAGNAGWVTGLSEDLKGYVSSKGFKDPSAILGSYRELESLIGAPKERLVKLPEKADDPSWTEVYTKLGRPTKPEEYGLTSAKGADPEFSAWAQKTFFDVGMSKNQSDKLIGKWNELQQQAINKQAEGKQIATDQERASLKKEWGAALEQNVNIATQAAKAFGLEDKTVEQIAGAIGVKSTMKLLHAMGSRIGEDSFITGGGGKGFGGTLTPAQAQNRLKELKADSSFTKRYLSGDVDAKDEMARVQQMAYPEPKD